MRIFLLISLVIFSTLRSHGQHSNSRDQFVQADNHAKNISRQLIYHPEILVDSLTRPFESDYSKTRAIYCWIAINIEYNFIGYKNGLKDVQNINEVLTSGKALCNGFSLLFDYLCDKAGIQSDIIEGYAKGYGYVNGQKFDVPNHAWNAVKIEGDWYLFDVTWASGISDKFVNASRIIDLDAYFMVDPQIFIKTHLPEDPTWQLLPSKQTLMEFEKGKGIEGNDAQINNFSPDDYLGMNEYDSDVLRFKRSWQFNPENINFIERLSFAYIYKGISITDGLWDMSFTELVEKSEYMEESFRAYMDSAWVLIDPLPLIRIQKARRIIQDEINYQKGVFYYEMGSDLFNKGYNSKQSLSKISDLTDTYFTSARQHFDSVSPSSIYAKDARDYLNLIKKYESRLRNP